MAKRQSYAQRKASLRRRTGLTPYQQRIASAAARGVSRQVARGHAQEATESRERRRRTRQRYGVGPETLRRLRNAVIDHGMRIIEALPVNPRPPKGYNQFGYARRALPSRETMVKGIRMLSGETLREMLAMQVADWQELASYQDPGDIENASDKYQNWTLMFDDGDAYHSGEDAEWNPWWYHRMGGYR